MSRFGSRHVWFKSSYSNGSGGECVACARAEQGLLTRDTKNLCAGTIFVGTEAWRAFVAAVREDGLLS
jgi:hypothetical protein